jgi:ribosome-binding factor A
LIYEQSNDPRLHEITVTGVDVNRDTSRAEVYYSMMGSPEERAEVQAALEGAAGWLRASMAPTLRLRKLPELIFIYDPSLERGARIDELLSELHEEEETEDEDGSQTAGAGPVDTGDELTGEE